MIHTSLKVKMVSLVFFIITDCRYPAEHGHPHSDCPVTQLDDAASFWIQVSLRGCVVLPEPPVVWTMMFENCSDEEKSHLCVSSTFQMQPNTLWKLGQFYLKQNQAPEVTTPSEEPHITQ